MNWSDANNTSSFVSDDNKIINMKFSIVVP